MFLNVKKLWTLLKPKWRYMHSQRASLIISASALAFLGPAQSMWPLQREPARASEKGLAISPPPPHPPENLSPTRLKSSRGRKKARLAALIKRPARRLLRKVSCTCKVRRWISIAGSCVQTSKQNFFSFPCTYHSGRIFRTNRSSKPVVYVWQNFTLSNVKSDLRNLKPLSYKSYCFLKGQNCTLNPPLPSQCWILFVQSSFLVKSPTSGEEWGYLISCDEAFEVT